MFYFLKAFLYIFSYCIFQKLMRPLSSIWHKKVALLIIEYIENKVMLVRRIFLRISKFSET